MQWKLRKDKQVFKGWRKETVLVDDLTCSGREFQRLGTATEKARVPTRVLTLETDKWKPDERSILGLRATARESMENRYEGSLEESLIADFTVYKYPRSET